MKARKRRRADAPRFAVCAHVSSAASGERRQGVISRAADKEGLRIRDDELPSARVERRIALRLGDLK